MQSADICCLLQSAFWKAVSALHLRAGVAGLLEGADADERTSTHHQSSLCPCEITWDNLGGFALC
eukprot:5210709-Amphidinium_carterae.2